MPRMHIHKSGSFPVKLGLKTPGNSRAFPMIITMYPYDLHMYRICGTNATDPTYTL